jgi:hypothetical protein
MDKVDHDGGQDELDEHSLPGSNQAGKAASSRIKTDLEKPSGSVGSQYESQVEKHSLPGTNQSEKRTGSLKKS